VGGGDGGGGGLGQAGRAPSLGVKLLKGSGSWPQRPLPARKLRQGESGSSSGLAARDGTHSCITPVRLLSEAGTVLLRAFELRYLRTSGRVKRCGVERRGEKCVVQPQTYSCCKLVRRLREAGMNPLRLLRLRYLRAKAKASQTASSPSAADAQPRQSAAVARRSCALPEGAVVGGRSRSRRAPAARVAPPASVRRVVQVAQSGTGGQVVHPAAGEDSAARKGRWKWWKRAGRRWAGRRRGRWRRAGAGGQRAVVGREAVGRDGVRAAEAAERQVTAQRRGSRGHERLLESRS